MAIYLGEGQVIDTDAFRNVSIRHLSDFETWKAKRYEGLTDININGIVSFMVERLNRPYDYLQILGFFVEIVFRWKNTWHLKNKYTCANIIDKAFKSVGIILVPGRQIGDVWPEKLYTSPVLTDVKE